MRIDVSPVSNLGTIFEHCLYQQRGTEKMQMWSKDKKGSVNLTYSYMEDCKPEMSSTDGG